MMTKSMENTLKQKKITLVPSVRRMQSFRIVHIDESLDVDAVATQFRRLPSHPFHAHVFNNVGMFAWQNSNRRLNFVFFLHRI